MIGSKRKVIEIFKTLQKEGVPANLFERVHAPVGLDIGAITPEEIAVAITAELIADPPACRAASAAHELVPLAAGSERRSPRTRRRCPR